MSNKIRVMLDPGHIEGYNYGYVKGYYEGSAMYDYAYMLKNALELNGFEVFITRKSIKDNPSLAQRGQMAIANKCDVFISLHSNAPGSRDQTSVCGVVTYRSIYADDSAKQLAKAITDTVVGVMNAHTGVTYSRGIQTALYPNHSDWDYYGVIRSAANTTGKGGVRYNMLIEHGFHTNPKECVFLADSACMKEMAMAVANRMAAFFGTSADEVPSGYTSIMGQSVATVEQMRAYLKKVNPLGPDYASIYMVEGMLEGVRSDVAFAQSMLETGNFKFTGDVTPDQNNFAGIGTTGGGVKGAYFSTPTEGVRAQIQHLKAYASKDALKSACVDPRFNLVSRGVAPTVQELSGRWAVPGYTRSRYPSLEAADAAKDTYGWSIVRILEAIMGTDAVQPSIPQEDHNTAPTMYRVRKSWADAKSQVGAYTVLTNAINACNANPGYSVYDGSGNVVYPATQPDKPKEIVKGGKVKVLKAEQYNGKSFRVYYDKYDVISVSNDRVVIGIGNVVTAAVNKNNLVAI